MPPNDFEIDDKMNTNECCQWILWNVFSCAKEKFVGTVKIVQDQQILDVTDPKGPVTFWISFEAWQV